jgi:hypothetical protein
VSYTAGREQPASIYSAASVIGVADSAKSRTPINAERRTMSGAELDGDKLGFLVARVAAIKGRR